MGYCGSKLRAALVGPALMVAAEAGAAVYLSGNDLYEKCNDRQRAAHQAFCLGFVAAISDVLSDDAVDGIRACVPNSVTLDLATRIVRAWLERNETTRQFAASSVAAAALAERFPCPQSLRFSGAPVLSRY